MNNVSVKILVSGWPLSPEAERLLLVNGAEVFVTNPSPDQREMVAALRAVSPDALIVRTGSVDRDCFDASPGLRVIANHGAGYDDIDVAEATRRGVPVFAAPGRNAISVAEHVLAQTLSIFKQLPYHDHLVRRGEWRPATPMTTDIHGKVMGLVGLGVIGQRVADLANAFGMSVIAYDPGRTGDWPEHVECCETLAALLGRSDVVSLHVPLTDTTKHLIDAEAVEMMKPGAVLVNAARGGVVDENALLNALDTGRIFGAGLDTFENEPPAKDSVLIQHERVLLTPHIAGVTPESATRMSLCCAENVLHFLSTGKGNSDLVNPESLIGPT